MKTNAKSKFAHYALNIASFRIIIFAINKLVTVVKGNQKALFSIDTTPKCKGRHYSFPWIDTYLILLSVKQGDIKYHF